MSWESVNFYTLQVWDDLFTCQGVKESIDSAVMRGDYMQSKLSLLKTFYGGSITVSVNDRIEICMRDCKCQGGSYGTFNVDGVAATGLTLNPNTLRPPRLLENGLHYEVCFIKNHGTKFITIPLGQTYIMKPLTYVYPFNRGIITYTLTTFMGEGGDIASGDELIFSAAPDCSLVDSYPKFTFTRQADSTFDKVKFTKEAVYQMCWRSAVSKDLAQPNSYIQVNNINYWMAVGRVRFSDNLSPESVNLQEKYIPYNLNKEVFLPEDQFKLYQASTFEDCYIPYRIGNVFTFNNIKWNGVPFFSPLWFGTKVGVAGISNSNNYLHICYHSFADQSPQDGKRLTNQDTSSYEV